MEHILFIHVCTWKTNIVTECKGNKGESICCRTTRVWSSFIPQAVRLLIHHQSSILQNRCSRTGPGRCHSAVLLIWHRDHSRYGSEKFPCGLKSIFLTDRHYKRDVCKTDDRTPRTADEVDYDSFWNASLIHGGFMFVKSPIWQIYDMITI